MMKKKWYSLKDKVYDKNNLYEAFKAVKFNKGAPGVDGETIDDFEAQLKEKIEMLHHELKTDSYDRKTGWRKKTLRYTYGKGQGSSTGTVKYNTANI